MVAQAKAACLRLLIGRRGVDRSELTQALSAEGYAGDVIRQVLGQLAETGLLDGSHTVRPGGTRRAVREDSESAGAGDDVEQSDQGRETPRAAGERRGRRSRSGDERGGGSEAQAKELCLRLLTDRARSRAELAEKLAAKGFAVEVGERVLDRLAEVGLIDDAAFAEQWVHSRHTYAGKGKKAIARELHRKGVDPADAEPALAGVTAEAEIDRATELVRRKLNSLPPDLDRDKAIRRLVGMLARRGYNQSAAYTVVKEELSTVDFAPTPKTSSPRIGSTSRPSAAPSPDDDLGEAHESEGDETVDEHAAATELVRRKLRTLPQNLERDKAIRRLVGMLARRGYNQSTAYTVVKAELSALDSAG